MTKEARIYNREDSIFKKWCWEIWTTTYKRMKLTLPSITHKNKLKMDKRPTCKTIHYKTLKGKHRKNTLWHKPHKIFFDLPPRIKKISKWYLTELKNFCTAKETKMRWKDNCQNGRKYLQMNNINKFNLQNIQIAHGAQYQEYKQPNQKMDARLK